MTTGKCVVCGDDFPARSARVLTCSTKCRTEFRSWPRWSDVTCAFCGLVTKSDKHHPKKFCNVGCRDADRAQSRLKSCPVCSCTFKADRAEQVCCSRSCSANAQSGRGTRGGKVPLCECGARVENKPRRYCSDACLAEHRKVRQKSEPDRILECLSCQEIFTRPWYYAGKQQYCSPICQKSSIKSSSVQEIALGDLIFSWGVRVIRRDHSILGGKELDIYCPDQKVAIECNGTYWHTHKALLNKGLSESAARSYHLDKTLECDKKGVRLIHVWEHMWTDPQKRLIYENMIRHALGLTENRVGARQTYVEKRRASTMRKFFEDNNIQGYRQARSAYVLVDKKSGLDLMCYTTGHAYFGKGLYDMEIARGACRLGWSVSGGATKLWKAVVADNPDVDSIVYYVDLNHYNGSSVSELPGAQLVKRGEPSLWNWWPKLGVMKNREPNRHGEIMEAYRSGDAVPVWNAGMAVYVWKR